MLFKEKIWDEQEVNREKAGFLAGELGISSMITGILLGRGLNTADEMRDFLYGKKQPFYDPLLMQDMEKACLRIENAIAKGEQITVYGDYDVDGISASSLLYLYLRSHGAKVDTYVPCRESEGYGLNDEALKTIFANGTTLLLTVDCGISALHEVENRPVGLDIIITDHHTVPAVLPSAYAIVNPHRRDCQYPFKDLSGVGVAFKLCQALEQRQGRSWSDLTELVALGTVADIVPLLDENREIVRCGLAAMENTKLVGLKALIKNTLGENGKVTSTNISFGLAPRLNSVGRLEHAKSAVELLVTDNEQRAQEIADYLDEENAERQKIGKQILEEAEMMLANQKHIDTSIILASENWHPGVIGIVASRLVDKYHLPTLLFSVSDGIAKGSCRSIPALDIYDALSVNSKYYLQFGGHKQAAGLTLKSENLEAFKRDFNSYISTKLTPVDYCQHQRIDVVLTGQKAITTKDVMELALIEPCGCENQSPIFAYHDARLARMQIIGEYRNHLRFGVSKGEASYWAVMWNRADLVTCLDVNGAVADVAFQPRNNEFRGEVNVQLNVLALRQAINIFDFRRSREDKFKILMQLLQTENRIDVFVSGDLLKYVDLFKEKLGDNAKYLRLHSYDDVAVPQNSTVILFDIPPVNLLKLTEQFRDFGVYNLFLLYNETDLYKFIDSHPNLQTMRQVYLSINNKFNTQGTFDYQIFLTENSRMSESMFMILSELNLVTLDGTFISEVKFQKTDITSSALYKQLQNERKSLEEIYLDNMRCTRAEILHR